MTVLLLLIWIVCYYALCKALLPRFDRGENKIGYQIIKSIVASQRLQQYSKID
jgi:hypothetical protein